MASQPVEWVLVVFYGPSAHQAIYGRQVRTGGYTKDYIQLSRKKSFLEIVEHLFSVSASPLGVVPLTYKWPKGQAPGAFVLHSGDRPHLKWETSLGAPHAWKMTNSPSDAVPETIPGDPSHVDFSNAENEFAKISMRGAGQPYLLAIKLCDEPRVLHLRTYLENPEVAFSWADVGLLPLEIQALTKKTSQQSALAWALFQSDGIVANAQVENALSQLSVADNQRAIIEKLDEDTSRALANYLRYPGRGLFFDPSRNHDAWLQPIPISARNLESVDDLLSMLDTRFSADPMGDIASEQLEFDSIEVEAFCQKIETKSYEVANSTATVKTRGSAQKAFAGAVKANYGNRCAVTGILTKDFLVASHIVPWSEDQSIRLDPSNGICLSLVVDRAFEKGYLLIDDELIVRIDWNKVVDDQALRDYLQRYDGQRLNEPSREPPNVAYLQRRRLLVSQIC